MNKTEILNFFDNQHIVILSTIRDGVPQTRALINIRNKNISPHLVELFKTDNRMLLMTNTHTDKIAEMHKNPNASLYAFNTDFDGVTLTGTVVELTDDETLDAIWDESLLHYYPGGRHGGDFSVIEFIPENFKTYRGSNFKKTSGNVK